MEISETPNKHLDLFRLCVFLWSLSAGMLLRSRSGHHLFPVFFFFFTLCWTEICFVYFFWCKLYVIHGIGLEALFECKLCSKDFMAIYIYIYYEIDCHGVFQVLKKIMRWNCYGFCNLKLKLPSVYAEISRNRAFIINLLFPSRTFHWMILLLVKLISGLINLQNYKSFPFKLIKLKLIDHSEAWLLT